MFNWENVETAIVWWDIHHCNFGSQHVIPMHDTHPHIPHDCTCNPRRNEDGVYVHNSFDGREDFETGKRKVS